MSAPKTKDESSINSKKKKGLFGRLKRSSKAEKTKAKEEAVAAAKAATNSVATIPEVFDEKPAVPVEAPKTTPHVKDASKKKKKGKGSWISRSKWFRDLSDNAFTVIDADESGCVDEKELYSGLLLIHLKLGSYAGPAACKPVDREKVHAVFNKMDADKSGSLDREEFLEVMTVLCSNVVSRVMAQWALTLLIVPLVAQYILDGFIWLTTTVWQQVTALDGVETVFDALQEQGEDIQGMIEAKIPASVLGPIAGAYNFVEDLVQQVPESVWESLPVTLISCVMGVILVPYTIFKIDEFFQNMADKKKTEHASPPSTPINTKKKVS
uniref:EF-hand domain-containing protein n=1 Tax=Grammatophora oceanica TaxID=210454 RepID=A0A7S1UZZ3_9STRA|mmetsp:Transcript_28953/g.42541  ORF Transcript_28953/g.42541 Transcript_28953/m.42541 type:complete len:325 (+) Transcript_28953:141-1115(+)